MRYARLLFTLLSAASVLAVGVGCGPIGVRTSPAALGYDGSTVAVNYDVRDIEELWAEDGEPLCSVRLGPSVVERWRDGSMWLDLGGGTRVAMPPADAGGYAGEFVAGRPRQLSRRMADSWLPLTGFIGAPFELIPARLADPSVAEGDPAAHERVRALAKYLLEAHPAAAGTGRIGRSGEVTVRVTLTETGRRQLLEVLAAPPG